MKTWFFFFFCLFFSFHAMGQVPITREKCKTCGKAISQCQYKGNHPKPQPAKPTPAKPTQTVKRCDICNKPLSQCDYGGDHPKCQTCGKLKEKCEYNGEHPKCQTCGKLKERCEYNGEHPKCPDCGKLKEQCEYKGLHLKSFSVGDVTFSMVPVLGGTFTMGATPEQQNPDDDEKPAHEVTLSSFHIGQTEVTQALWKAVMGENPSYFKGDNLPVERVSWDDCQTFIRKLNEITKQNFRLPTEAEWEFAARGGNKSRGYQYSGSKTLDEVAWYESNSSGKTHPVGSKAPNELGLFDMSGNVWEWCQDWKGEYPSTRQTDPKGPDSGTYRVGRGGSWDYYAGFCRSSFRSIYAPDNRYDYLGLRLVLPELRTIE